MGIALLTHTAAGTSNNNDITSSAIDTSGASLLVLGCHDFDTAALSVITDSKSNTWVPRTSYLNTGLERITLFYAQGSITVGSGHTFTATRTLAYPSIYAASFSGVHATPYDTENGAASLSAAGFAPGSITPSEDNCLIISAVVTGSAGTAAPYTVGSGMTLLDELGANSGGWGGGMAYKIQTSTAAINPTWSYTDTQRAAATIASFKAAAATSSIAAISSGYHQRGLR